MLFLHAAMKVGFYVQNVCKMWMCLIVPEISESLCRKLGISHCMLYISMAEIVLNCACIVSSVSQIESAGMPEHVRVNGEGDLRNPAGTCDNLTYAGG